MSNVLSSIAKSVLILTVTFAGFGTSQSASSQAVPSVVGA